MMMVVVDFNHRPTTLNLDLEDNIMMMMIAMMMVTMMMVMMMVVAGYLKRRLTLHTGERRLKCSQCRHSTKYSSLFGRVYCNY